MESRINITPDRWDEISQVLVADEWLGSTVLYALSEGNETLVSLQEKFLAEFDDATPQSIDALAQLLVAAKLAAYDTDGSFCITPEGMAVIQFLEKGIAAEEAKLRD